jgi:hypothetical protein
VADPWIESFDPPPVPPAGTDQPPPDEASAKSASVMNATYAQAVVVVGEAIRWYSRNPQAEASVAEVIVSSLVTAGLLSDPDPKADSGEAT